MKLSSARIEQTIRQANTHAVALPENHPKAPELHELFGDHSFFLDEEGLRIVEPAETSESGREAGELVELAAWDDAARTTLAAHTPERTGVIIIFASSKPDRVDRAGLDSFPASDPTLHNGVTGDE